MIKNKKKGTWSIRLAHGPHPNLKEVEGWTKEYEGIKVGFHKGKFTDCFKATRENGYKSEYQGWIATHIDTGLRILADETLDACEEKIIAQLPELKDKIEKLDKIFFI